MYKIAIVMNIGFMIISYVCALYVIRCLYPGLNDKLKQMICVASIASCTMLFYSQIAWCETFITTLMWCLIALFVRLERRWSYITPVLIAAIIIAIYLTHQRAILLLPLATGLLLLNCIQNRKYIFAVCILVLSVLCLIGYRRLHDYQLNLVYGASEASRQNNVTVSSSFVGGYLNKLEVYWREILHSFVCKTGVALLTTYCTMFIACKEYINRLAVKNFSFWGSRALIILSAAMMVVLSSIQMFGIWRKDYVVYSRYMDFALPGIALIGLCDLLEHMQKYKKLYMFSTLIAVCTLLFSINRINISEGSFNVLSSPLWGSLLWHFGENGAQISGWLLAEICLAFIPLAAYIGHDRGQKGKYVFMCLLILLNVWGYGYANDRTVSFRKYFQNNCSSVRAALQEYPDESVYYLMPPLSVEWRTEGIIKELQFEIYDKPIQVLDASIASLDIPEGSLLIVDGEIQDRSFKEHYEPIVVNKDSLSLYKYHTEKAYEYNTTVEKWS